MVGTCTSTGTRYLRLEFCISISRSAIRRGTLVPPVGIRRKSRLQFMWDSKLNVYGIACRFTDESCSIMHRENFFWPNKVGFTRSDLLDAKIQSCDIMEIGLLRKWLHICEQGVSMNRIGPNLFRCPLFRTEKLKQRAINNGTIYWRRPTMHVAHFLLYFMLLAFDRSISQGSLNTNTK